MVVPLHTRRAQVGKARESLDFIRGLKAKLDKDCADLQRDQTRTPAYRGEQARRLADKAKQEAKDYLAQQGVRPMLAEAVGARADWSPSAFLQRQRFTPELPHSVRESAHLLPDRMAIVVMADVREELTAQRWLTTVPRLSLDELRKTFSDALADKQLAIAGLVMREANWRRDASRAAVPTASHAELIAGADVRALPRQLEQALEQASLPELTEADEVFTELQAVGNWIDEAEQNLITGSHDFGIIQQRAFELRKGGADTSEKMRAADEAA